MLIQSNKLSETERLLGVGNTLAASNAATVGCLLCN